MKRKRWFLVTAASFLLLISIGLTLDRVVTNRGAGDEECQFSLHGGDVEVHLKADVTPAQHSNIEEKLDDDKRVAEVEYLSSQQATKEALDDYPADVDPEGAEELADMTLPPLYRLTLASGAAAERSALMDSLEGEDGVDWVWCLE